VNGIAVARLGAVDEEVIRVIARTIADSFGARPVVLDRLCPVEHAHDKRRDQYSSFVLLRDLLLVRPLDTARVLGVTECDLYVPMLSFVFGQAQLGGPAAVVSTARLSPAFYGLHPQRDLLAERTIKTVLHELGHTFGLIHCSDRTCAMALATGVAQLDSKLPRFCPNCWPRTQGILT
jgi:archaemetzincin